MAYNTYGDIGSGILDWLSGAAAQRPGRPGTLPGGRPPGLSMGFGYGAMSTPLPGGGSLAPPMPPPGMPPPGMPPGFGAPPAIARPQGPLPGLGGPGYTSPSGPSTKTEPRAPLRFAWGGNAPEDYQPGITDVLKMRGAPGLSATSPGGPSSFMGVTPPVGGGGVSGGFSPRPTSSMTSDEMIDEAASGRVEQDWSRVANPSAFEAYRERPILAEIERAAKDPLWREREMSGMELSRAKELKDYEAQLQNQSSVALRTEVNKEVTRLIAQENQRRASAGQPPLTEEEGWQRYFPVAQMMIAGRGGTF